MSTFPRQVQRYTEREFDRLRSPRAASLEHALADGEIEAYIDTCRTSIRALYPMPETRTPLNTTVTGVVRHDEYRIEKLHFESRPGLIVTANLYVPERDGPLPCVLGACGHSELGKAEAKYQSFCAGLASKGFLVLIYDPISQGERIQFTERKTAIGGCVAEHVTIGTKQSLVGEYFGAWRAWDGIRALDVLLERPEADPTRVGMTGNSGGGTMTTIVTALEDRLTMAAPSCFVTTYRHNLENELPSDTEQTPPGIIAEGYEEYDHLIAAAPRPTLICTKADDFFDHRGAEEAYEILKRVYAALGRSDDVAFATATGGHGFDRPLREAMYAFFIEHAGVDESSAEPDVTIHPPEELNAAPEGTVHGLASRKVLDYCRDTLETATHEAFSPDRLASLLALPERGATPPPYRILRRRNGRSRFAVETESDLFAILSFGEDAGSSFTLPSTGEVELVLPHLDEDVLDDGALDAAGETRARKHVRMALSTRGSGESRYDTANGRDYFDLYDADYLYSSYGIMMNRPLAGGKTFDVLRTVNLLEGLGVRVTALSGRGCGALISLYAAPFIAGLERLVLTNCIPSMRAIVDTDRCLWPQSVLIPEILRWFDLADIVAFLERDRGVEVVIEKPWNAELEPV